jgi:hypothetical protein
MAAIVNARDVLLQASDARTVGISISNLVLTTEQLGSVNKGVTLKASSQVFQISKTNVVTPASVTLAVTIRGFAAGTVPTLTLSAGTMSVTPSFTNGVYSVNPADMTSDVVTFKATVTETDAEGNTLTYADEITVIKVREGVDAINGLLTNESFAIPADHLGNILSWTGAGGSFKVFHGTVDVSNVCTFQVLSNTSSVQTTINSSGVYSVTDLWPTGADSVSVTYRATFGTSLFLDKTFTLSRVKSGTQGSGFTITATSQTFTFDAAGAASPASQTITFNAILTGGLSGTAIFVCTLYNSSGTSLGTVTLGGTGNTRTLTLAQFSTAAYAVVSASLSTFSDQVTVVRLKDGANSVSGFLTNESHVIATDAAGTISSYTGSGGTFKVFDGLVDKTTSGQVTYSAPTQTGITATINSSGVYTLSGMTADTATVTFQAIYTGVTPNVTIQKQYTIAKSKAGTSGAAFVLTATAQTFTYDSSGAANPASQTITFTAVLSGSLTGTANFVCTLYNAAGASLGTVVLGGTGNSRTLTHTQFGTAQYAIVAADLSGFSDQITVYRLKDGVNAITGFLTNESHTLPADKDGVVAAGAYASAGGTFKVYDGLTDVTASGQVTFLREVDTGITSTLSTSGVYSVSGMGAGTDVATCLFRATYKGVIIQKLFTVTKAKTGANGANGANGVRGSKRFVVSGRTSWDSTVATTTASVDGGPVLMDEVTQTNNTSFSETRYYDGSTWIVAAASINGNLVVNGTIIGDKMAANTITAAKIATGTITATQIASDAITSAKILAGAVDATKIQAGSIKAEHVVVAPRSLNPDPFFAQTTRWNGFAERQARASAPGGNCPHAWAARFTAQDNYRLTLDDWVSVVPGETYRVSCWVWRVSTSTPVCGVMLAFGNAAGSIWNGTQLGNQISSAGSWQFVQGTYTVPADGSVRYLSVGPWNASAHATGNWFSDLQIEKMADANLIVDGAVTASKINIKNGATSGRVEISNNRIEVYDTSNVLRVRIGLL